MNPQLCLCDSAQLLILIFKQQCTCVFMLISNMSPCLQVHGADGLVDTSGFTAAPPEWCRNSQFVLCRCCWLPVQKQKADDHSNTRN